jgi:hypothetical protein
MLKIGYTVLPPVQISQEDWMAEFRVGLMAPKKNDRAKDIMDTWTVDHKPVDWKKFIQKKLESWH